MKQMLSFTLNGLTVEALAKPTDTLLDLLREQLGVTGPKRGCDSGDCGACMVLLDGQAVNACLVIALTVAGREVTTVEGLPPNFTLFRRLSMNTGPRSAGSVPPG
jgi:aerobic-type carbon monoxide dehydrogenase small subunit (CoxS/CutS family)